MLRELRTIQADEIMDTDEVFAVGVEYEMNLMMKCDPWLPNPEWQWWKEPCGPIELEECMCQRCNQYLVCCEIVELWTLRACYLCHRCSGWVLDAHAICWDIHTCQWV